MPHPGTVNNAAGRPKGSVNKNTKPIKEAVKKLLESYSPEEMIKDLRALEPAERLKIITGLLNYTIPKIQHNINDNVEVAKVIGITFIKEDEQEDNLH